MQREALSDELTELFGAKEFIGTLKDTDVIFLILGEKKNNPIRRRNKGNCYAWEAELSGANWVELRLLYKDQAVRRPIAPSGLGEWALIFHSAHLFANFVRWNQIQLWQIRAAFCFGLDVVPPLLPPAQPSNCPRFPSEVPATSRPSMGPFQKATVFNKLVSHHCDLQDLPASS